MSSRGMNGVGRLITAAFTSFNPRPFRISCLPVCLPGHVVLAVLLLSGVLASASDDSSLSKFAVIRGSRRILGNPDLSATAEEITDIEQAKESEIVEAPRRMLGRTPAYGGNGGTAFDHHIHSRISFLQVMCGDSLHSLAVTYTDSRPFQHGGAGGKNGVTIGNQFVFMYDPNQRVTIDVCTGSRMDKGGAIYKNIVRGMFFYQDKRNNGGVLEKDKMVLICGTCSGMTRSRAVTKHILKGFHGRAGRFIDQIGFYI